jgi:hypothetical protein
MILLTVTLTLMTVLTLTAIMLTLTLKSVILIQRMVNLTPANADRDPVGVDGIWNTIILSLSLRCLPMTLSNSMLILNLMMLT